MQKFTFTVELVSNDIDELTVCGLLKAAVDSLATYDCVSHTGTKALTEQGLKVWAKRKCNISLAQPKPEKAQKNVQVTA
jgi:hypothetical protein